MDFIFAHYFLARGTYSAVNACGQKNNLMAQPQGCGVLSIHTYDSIGSHMSTNGKIKPIEQQLQIASNH
jgi:hypothetical protein